jgi:hypothetical protein
MKLKITLLLLLIATSFTGFTQDGLQNKQTGYYSLSLGAGTANYFGDLINPGNFGQPGLNISAGLEYQWKPRWSFRTNIQYFHISGDDNLADDDREERNLSFYSNNWELDVTAHYNFVKIPEDGYAKRKLANVYLFAGAGLMLMNPKATRSNGRTVELQPLETEGVSYSRLQFVVPFGIGSKIKIDPRFNLLLEAGYRFTFSDYLDDISSERYPNPATLKSDLSREMSDRRREIDPGYPLDLGKRGNGTKHDGYLLFNLSLQYTFGNNKAPASAQ